jgi:formylglycine-generating enzyme required for sulfatase activity
MGQPPFYAETALETMQQVLEREPLPPSRRGVRVPRDLETICLKCLNKAPARRYASADHLANDLRLFLAGEPIRARAVGAAERTWKWARRRPALASLLGVVLLALVGLSALSVVALDRQQKAQREADKARKARDFLVGIFRIKDIRAGNTTTARQIMSEGKQRIPVEFANQPDLRDELLAAIENVNRNLDRTIPAAMILETRGAVSLRSARGDGARPVPQTLLYPDDRLTLALDAHVRIAFMSDLHQERLEPGREATIGRTVSLPPDAVRERDDSVLMTFVRLPKGTFYMGWDGTPGSAKATEIKEDFEIALHDVTQGQWEAIMGDNPSWFSRAGGGRNWVLDNSDEELKLFPVENVSWHDARNFIKKLNATEAGRGYLYRLPSEAEWEYACRAGATSLEECSNLFYFDKPTNALSSAMANFNGNEPYGGAPTGPWLPRPTRVGAYPSNRLGLCDMHGNVWQWTDTAWGSGRVDRGGSWRDNSLGCRAGERFKLPPTVQGINLGFRLARVPVR